MAIVCAVKAEAFDIWSALPPRPAGDLDDRKLPLWSDPMHLKVFVIEDIPAEYTSGATQVSAGGSSTVSDSQAHRHPDGALDEKAFSVHRWMVDQLRASPLRTYSEEDADIFIVPTFFAASDTVLQVSHLLCKVCQAYLMNSLLSCHLSAI